MTASNEQLVQTVAVPPGSERSRLQSAIYVLLLLIPIFATVVFGGVDNTTWIFISLAWAILIFLWIAEAWRQRGVLFNPSPLMIPIAGFLLVGVIQLLPLRSPFGAAGVSASAALSLDPYTTRIFVTKLAVYVIYLAACLTFVNTEKRLKKLVLTVVIFGALMAFFAILQQLANPQGIYGIRGTPQALPFGPFVNRHHFAAFMQMTAGLALALVFGSSLERDKKILAMIAVVVMGAAALWTSSRGGVLGFAMTFAFVISISFLSAGEGGKNKEALRRKAVLAAAGLALILVIVGVVVFVGGNDQLLRGIGVANESSDLSTGRFHFWPVALQIFTEHPIIGAGMEAFGVAFTRHDTWSGALRVEQAHNEYLQVLAEAGIVGFACVATFIYFLFRGGLQLVSKVSGFRREAAVGALAGCLGILVHSFFDFPLRTPSNAFFFLMLCAVATVSVATTERRRTKQ